MFENIFGPVTFLAARPQRKEHTQKKTEHPRACAESIQKAPTHLRFILIFDSFFCCFFRRCSASGLKKIHQTRFRKQVHVENVSQKNEKSPMSFVFYSVAFLDVSLNRELKNTKRQIFSQGLLLVNTRKRHLFS
jgi:hypothetical protein